MYIVMWCVNFVLVFRCIVKEQKQWEITKMLLDELIFDDLVEDMAAKVSNTCY